MTKMARQSSRGWQRCRGYRELQVSFRKRDIDYVAHVSKISCEDKTSYASSPPCTKIMTVYMYIYMYMYIYICSYLYMHIHTHMYMYIYTHIWIHTYMTSYLTMRGFWFIKGLFFVKGLVLCFLNIQKRFSFSSNQKKNDGEFCPVPLAMQQLLGQMQNKHIDCMYV